MAAATEYLDTAVLAAIVPRWTKVAMVLACATEAPNFCFGEDEDDYEILAERLVQLVASGRVLAQGDLKHWRFSEVRLANTDRSVV